jgi:hypothetical protein
MDGFWLWLAAVGVPGPWIKQFFFLVGLAIYGSIMCKEKRIINEVYWKTTGIFSAITIMRWLGWFL